MYKKKKKYYAKFHPIFSIKRQSKVKILLANVIHKEVDHLFIQQVID